MSWRMRSLSNLSLWRYNILLAYLFTLTILGQQSCLYYRQRSEDEARDTFKTLKSQLIGDSFAYLYSEWALLENQAGKSQHLNLKWDSNTSCT